MPIVINTDGGSRCRHGGTPESGAAWAFVVQTPSHGRFTNSGFLDCVSNNEAEYQAIIEALEWLDKNNHLIGNLNILIKTDSELAKRQISGEYQVRKPHLLPYWALAVGLIKHIETEYGTNIEFQNILREENKEADALCNAEMDQHGGKQ